MAASKETGFSYPYASPTPGLITVVATGLEKELSEVFPTSVFEDLVECNFNLVSMEGSENHSSGTPAFMDTLANTKGKIGVLATNYYFLPPHTSSNKDEFLGHARDFYDVFKNYTLEVSNQGFEPIKAWALKDEPHYDQIDDITDGYNLHTIYDYIRNGEIARKKQDPSKSLRPVQINLVGSGENKFMTGITVVVGPGMTDEEVKERKYQVYLNTFKKNFQPTLWSYDLYPITQRSCLMNGNCSPAGNCAVSVDANTQFYRDLDTFSRLARETSGVFWAYAQSLEFISSDGRLFPAATEPYLRFEVFSALAFGAQGIVYWTYQQRPNENGETYFAALVDRHLNRFPAWYAAQKVNAEVKVFSEVFVGSSLLEFAHIGTAVTGYPVHEGDFGPIRYISASSVKVNDTYTAKVQVAGKGVLMTRLRTRGSVFVIIVSHDVVYYQDISISFNPNASIMTVKPNEAGKLTYTKIRTDMSYIMKLAPGGYLVFRHDNA